MWQPVNGKATEFRVMEVSRQKAFIFFEKRFYSWTEGGN
jgi:hypothetical protein